MPSIPTFFLAFCLSRFFADLLFASLLVLSVLDGVALPSFDTMEGALEARRWSASTASSTSQCHASVMD